MEHGGTLLIVGGAGYIGSTVAFRALSQSKLKVIVFDRLMYTGSSLYPFFAMEERFEFVFGDCRMPRADWTALLKEKKVDYVFNAAALVGEHICKKYPEDAQQINEDATIDIAEAAAAAGQSLSHILIGPVYCSLPFSRYLWHSLPPISRYDSLVKASNG